MGKRYLIINADDFGISESANQAIELLFREKRITSSTLMAPAAYAGAAAEAAARGRLPVGVHLTLNSDWKDDRWHSTADRRLVPSLDDGDGLLYDTRQLSKQAKASQVTRELEAQVAFMVRRGCPPDHADNHCGTLYGTNGRLFFINAFRLCRKYRLPFRFPKGSRFLERQYKGGVPKALQAAHAVIAGLAGLMGVALIDDMITNPCPVEEIGGYDGLSGYYLRQVAEMGEGVTELFLHPAYPDKRISAFTAEWAKRELELQFLMKDDLLKLVEKEDISLVSWKEAFFNKT